MSSPISTIPTSYRLRSYLRQLLPAALVSTCGACGFIGDGGPVVSLSFDPHEATIAQLRAFVKTGIVPCRTLIEQYELLHDAQDPSLHAIVSWNQQVLDDADRLDQIPPTRP